MTPRLWAPMIVAVLASSAGSAHAFPPYRSTDADTADPWYLEGRLGLLRLSRDAGENVYISPLLRVNLGLPRHIELVSELEYVPDAAQLGDAAVGAKWIPFTREHFNLGFEALLLLPVSSEGGAGTEVSLLATYKQPRYQVHVNATGFIDARPSPRETGWKLGAVAEARMGRMRPGLETYARQITDDDVQVYAGAGVIVGVRRLDVRTGIQVGLNDAARDVVASLWLATKLPVR